MRERPPPVSFFAWVGAATLVFVASAWMFMSTGGTLVLLAGLTLAAVLGIAGWMAYDASTVGLERRPWIVLVLLAPALTMVPAFSEDADALIVVTAFVTAVALAVLIVAAYLVARELRQMRAALQK